MAIKRRIFSLESMRAVPRQDQPVDDVSKSTENDVESQSTENGSHLLSSWVPYVQEKPIPVRITDSSALSKLNGKWIDLIDVPDLIRFRIKRPLAVYECSPHVELQPNPRLNSYVQSIVVAEVEENTYQSVSYAHGRLYQEEYEVGESIVVYYRPWSGLDYGVLIQGIYDILCELPELVISKEGILVFYTEREILATADMIQYFYVTSFFNNDRIKRIESIEDCIDYLCIHLEDKSGERYRFRLDFDLDLSQHAMITPRVEYLSQQEEVSD